MTDMTGSTGAWCGIPGGSTTWEYPYFRDSAENWKGRLLQLRQLGARVISTYIPWRHHELPTGGLDFSGATSGNRNLLHFIELCRELDLCLVLKPGPFCHAELNYGGLPDRVRPGPQLAAQKSVLGADVTWVGAAPDRTGQAQQWALPSLADPRFMAEVDDWLLAVREQVLRAAAEQGTLVALQIGNEGVYSDAQHPIWAHDYSGPAVAEYRTWLAAQYDDVAALAAAHEQRYQRWADVPGPQIPAQLPALSRAAPWLDWSRWQAVALGRRYAHWNRLLQVGVPVFVNVNPPLGESWGIDAWLARVDPACWDGVRYGYTNWIGLAAREPSALARYQLLTRISPGPNFEENWGFSEQYDIRYQYPNVCFQQSLVALAGGAHGINFYTAVSTDAWTEDLDRFEPRPYPAHAAIRPNGEVWGMTDVVQDLAGYLAEHGEELAQSQPVGAVSWAVDRSASWLAAWSGAGADSPGAQYLAVHAALTAARIDLDIVDITYSVPDPVRHPVLLLAGLPAMHRQQWAKLCEYAAAGGRPIFLREHPKCDEHDASIPALFPVVRDPDSVADILLQTGQGRALEVSGDALVWLRQHPVTDVLHIVIVTRDDAEIRMQLPQSSGALPLEVKLAPDAGALIRVDQGKITAALLKGTAEQTGARVATAITLGDQRIVSEGRGDLRI